MPSGSLDRGFVLKLRDKAFEQRKRRFASHTVAVVQGVFTWGLDREHTEHNIRKIKPIKRPRDMDRANRPWTRAEWDAVTAAAPPRLLAPILLHGMLGWREGEALTRPRTDYDSVEKKIKRVSLKSGKRVKTPVPKLISDALDALFPHEATTLLVNSRGQPWTEDGFRASMWTLLEQVKAGGKIPDGLTVHGLRHTCGTLMS
jgi:integrase